MSGTGERTTGQTENRAGRPGPPDPAVPADAPFAAVLRYFLRLRTLGLGDPIAVVGYTQRELVEQRGWIGKQDFLDEVALGQRMPGPLAAQVAKWVGSSNAARWASRRPRSRSSPPPS